MYNRFSAYQLNVDPSSTLTLSGGVDGQATITPGQPSSAVVALAPVPGQPAGTFGSASAAVVATVNAAGQIVETDQIGIKAIGLTHSVTFTYTGDATGGPTSFDGTADVSTALTLATVATPGTNTKITYNAKGLVTVGAQAALASADYANQGTVTTVLHGNAAGNPSWGAVTLTTDVTGILPAANGGTGATSLSAALDAAFGSTRGAILYRGASGWAILAPGTAGTKLTSNGAGADPTWT